LRLYEKISSRLPGQFCYIDIDLFWQLLKIACGGTFELSSRQPG
jgi:hypothetical protein